VVESRSEDVICKTRMQASPRESSLAVFPASRCTRQSNELWASQLVAVPSLPPSPDGIVTLHRLHPARVDTVLSSSSFCARAFHAMHVPEFTINILSRPECVVYIRSVKFLRRSQACTVTSIRISSYSCFSLLYVWHMHTQFSLRDAIRKPGLLCRPVSICLFVTLVYSIQTAKDQSINQSINHDF